MSPTLYITADGQKYDRPDRADPGTEKADYYTMRSLLRVATRLLQVGWDHSNTQYCSEVFPTIDEIMSIPDSVDCKACQAMKNLAIVVNACESKLMEVEM